MILPPAIDARCATIPLLPVVHDVAELLFYQSPQLQRHVNRLAAIEATSHGVDLDGATDPQELS